MRILLANQFFWPDSAATSQLLTDLAQGLADLGHEVHVVCGNAGYTEVDSSPEPNVSIHRSPCLPFGRSKVARLFSYFSFFATAAVIGVTSRKFDLVITLTTPPLLSVMGTIMKRLRGTRHYIWEMDIYPDVAVDLGMWKPDSAVTRAVGAVADFSRANADGVIALGDCMRDRLMGRGLDGARIHVAQNWSDGDAIEPLPLRGQKEFKILYSGNLGLAHDVDTIYGAMLRLKNDHRFRFIFAGGGALREDLQTLCQREHIDQAAFRPYCERGLLSQSLGEGDLGLVTQRAECSGSVVPSKVYGLMAAGRPLLYIGPRDSTPAHIIQEFHCGWHVDIGDVDGLVNLLQLLESDDELLRDAGQRGRQAFLKHFDKPLGVARVCSILGAAATEPVTAPVFVEAADAQTTSAAR
jgi:glycosyltransferase involved in cell wall biosynthesis